MDKTILPILLSGQRLQGHRVDMIASNLANLSTDGFRAQRPLASEMVLSRGGPSLSLPRFAATMTPELDGPLEMTGAPLDLAVIGPGFFLVEDSVAGRLLTRAGRFVTQQDGSVVTPSGARLLDNGGAPVQLLPGSAPPVISEDGTLSQDGVALAQIGIWRGAAGMERRSGAAFAAPPDAALQQDGRLRQGAVEGANVDPVSEMAAMIEASRRYTLMQSLSDREDGRIRNVIETFSRAS
ncbi:MAG: flagellar hook-basal body complex protein [Pseudomonadota bacterium]